MTDGPFPVVSNRETRLVRTPRVLPFEPLSCWVGRLALSQGASLREVAEFIGLELRSDLDLHVSEQQVSALAAICGLDTSAFALPRRIFTALRSIAPDGEPFLGPATGKARFRYCSECMAAFRTPYFQLHWRFVAWRHCPVHKCLLEDQCPHCGEPIFLPADQVNAGPEKSGVALLSLCMQCGKALTEVKSCSVFEFASEWQRTLMSNGRAVLAALYTGRVEIAGDAAPYTVRKLLQLQRRGLLPPHFGWLSPGRLRKRGAL